MKADKAYALIVTGSGARTGKYAQAQTVPMPKPAIIWNPTDFPLDESSVSVLISPTPIVVNAHPTYICGLYRLKIGTEILAGMATGAVEKLRASRSTPEAIGEASLHA